MTDLLLNPDRLLPADPSERSIARRILAEVEGAPIYSPHGHVAASLLASDHPFADPARMLVTPDHYVTRLLHATGVPLDELGLGAAGRDVSGREIWRRFSRNWSVFAGTPVRYWFEVELRAVFGITEVPSAANADRVYDELVAALATAAFRPRALFERFGIRVLATTDDPVDDLSGHQALAADPEFTAFVLPTFRADRFMDPAAPGWADALAELARAADVDTGSYDGLLAALRARRQYFIDNGATSTDTGVLTAACEPLPRAEAARIHSAALRGEIPEQDAAAYRANMLYRFAELSAADGLVMQLHAGVIRNHHEPTLWRFGADTGHDLPAVGGYTRELGPILRDFGTDPRFRMILFTVDETLFSREIGPLAGFYPAVYAGAPWWFLDSPAAIRRFRAAVTDSAGFAKTSGFVDDTRAFCSIPARHDMSRRIDAGHLASLVATHELGEDEATEIARRLVSDIPRRAFNLPA